MTGTTTLASRRAEASRWTSVRVPLLLVSVTAFAVVPGVLVALVDGGPTVFNDELIYRDDAQSLAGRSAYADPHYPPVYPLLLSVGFATSDPFRTMLVLNAVASAMVVPATWFLARVLGFDRPWIPTVLAALLPVHGAFAGYLLSENLAVAVFVLCVALAVRGRPGDAVVFGLALGALHLTRFIFLPAVVLLAGVWLLRVVRGMGTSGVRRARGPLLRLCAAYLVLLAAWASYGTLSGHPFGSLWGLSTVEDGAARAAGDARILSAATWLTQYTSYLALAVPVAIALVLAWLMTSTRGWWRSMATWTPRAAFGAVTLLMTVGYLSLATVHSSGVEYNNPSPSHMQGRYMMHLVPCVVVAGCMALERAAVAPRRRAGLVTAAASGAVAAAAAWGAWWVLFHGGIWSVPAWGAQLPFNAVDVFVLENRLLLAVMTVACVAVPVLARRSAVAAAVVWTIVSALVLSAGVVAARSAPVNGARERVIAEAAADRGAAGERVTVWVSNQVLDTASVSHAVAFWAAEPKQVTVEAWDAMFGETAEAACVVPSGSSTELWVTARTVTPRAETRDLRVGDGFSVVDVAPGCMERVVADWVAATSGQETTG